MALINSSISPLPFYESVDLQNHRKSYAFGQIYGLITYRNMLMPFQFILNGEGHDTYRLVPRYVVIVNANTGEETRIGTPMIEVGLKITHYEDFSVVKYPGILPIATLKEEGRYYLKITLRPVGSYPTIEAVSEIFTISNNVDDCVLLEYGNSYNFELRDGFIDFSENFRFRCYLQTQIGKPDYEFEEEATERMGYAFMESQVSKKVYHFTFLAPEYLCDALRIVRMCDNKRIASKFKNYELTTFTIEPEWQDQGDLAAVECSFETDTVIANIGGYEPKPLGGDFNPDHNKDFYDITIGPDPELPVPPYVKSGVGVLLSDGTIMDYNHPNFADIDTTKVVCLTLQTVLADYNNQAVNLFLAKEQGLKYFSNGQRPVDASLYKYENLVNVALYDFDGENNTKLLIKTLYNDTTWAAIWCSKQTLNGKACYLPAEGECNAIIRNIATINNILTKLSLPIIGTQTWLWSSSVNKKNDNTDNLGWVFGVKGDGSKDSINVQGMYLAWPVAKMIDTPVEPENPDTPDVPVGDNLVTQVTMGSWGAIQNEDMREFTPATYPNSEYSWAFYHTNLISVKAGDIFRITIPDATGTVWMCCYDENGVATLDAYTIGINQQFTIFPGSKMAQMGFNIKVEDISYIKSDLFTPEQAKTIIITKEN